MGCSSSPDLESLVQYWLGELEPDREALFEEHYFACAACSQSLEDLVALRDGVRAAFAQGLVHTFFTPAFASRLADRGLRVREYRVTRGGSVNCTVGPDDDVVLGRMAAPLGGVRRVDAILRSANDTRVPDLPFDPEAGEVVLAPSMRWLRSLSTYRDVVRLVAVEDDGERVLGDYTFDHSAWPGAAAAPAM